MWLLALVFVCGICLGIYNLIFKRKPILEAAKIGSRVKAPRIPRCDYCGSSGLANQGNTCKGCGAPRPAPNVPEPTMAPRETFLGSHPTSSGGHTLPTFLIRLATGGSPYPEDPKPNVVRFKE